MFRIASSSAAPAPSAKQGFLVGALFIANLVFGTVSNSSFKLSAMSTSWKHFILWQVVGNLAGFLGVLALTGVMRFIPLHVAHPIAMGLTVISVQVVAAGAIFREAISPMQWVGTGLIVVGILLIGGR